MYWLALADFREKGSDNEISFERGFGKAVVPAFSLGGLSLL